MAEPEKVFSIFAKKGRKRPAEGEAEQSPAKKAKKNESEDTKEPAGTSSSSSSSSTTTTTTGAARATGFRGELQAQLPDEWSGLQKELNETYFVELCRKVEADMKKFTVFPPTNQIFAAFHHTPLSNIKVVILGQDPYHDVGQAHGLCFSVPEGHKVPPSLRNMYKELADDIPGFKIPQHGNLEAWAKQGVLLLNATLTVNAHTANSHATYGWQKFTDNVIKFINAKCTGVVFLLWGGFAQKKGKIINKDKHHVITAAHPSPLSVKHWVGCKVFSKTNAKLRQLGKEPINWQN